jgi:hypothetical protein
MKSLTAILIGGALLVVLVTHAAAGPTTLTGESKVTHGRIKGENQR